MTLEVNLLWEKVLDEAERKLSKPSFETWLKPTKPLSIKENRIIVEVPNDFTRDWLETRHKQLLLDAIKKYHRLITISSSPVGRPWRSRTLLTIMKQPTPPFFSPTTRAKYRPSKIVI